MPNDGTEQRKLAAIMFTDMVGYSALAQRNEALALDLLEEQQRLVRPIFPRFGGREVKSTGDGFLVEFASALAAAQCAIEVQRALVQHNASASHERRFQIRIGVHLGDVVLREADIFGDGVNIAARIEPLAEAGGICLSRPVVDQIANKIGAPLVKLGTPELKNIQMPMEVYRVVLPWQQSSGLGQVSSSRTTRRPKRHVAILGLAATVLVIGAWVAFWPRAGTRKNSSAPSESATNASPIPALNPLRIALLPFENLSPERENEYFARVIADQLWTKLSEIGGLAIVPVSGTNFAGLEPLLVGQKANSGTLLTGSASKIGGRIQVNVRLVAASGGEILWAEPFVGEFKDLETIQNKVALKVAHVLKVKLLEAERRQIEKKYTDNTKAFELYLKGRDAWNSFTSEGLRQGIVYFRQAIAEDRDYALAYSGLADCYSILAGDFEPAKPAFAEAERYAQIAVQRDPGLTQAQVSLGMYFLFSELNWDKAREHFNRAVQIKPRYADAHHYLAHYFESQGQLEEAKKEWNLARQFDPLSSIIAAELAQTYLFAGDYPRAIALCREAVAMDAEFVLGLQTLGAALTFNGEFPEAIEKLQRARTLNEGDRPIVIAELGHTYAKAGNIAAAREQVRKLLELQSRGRFVDPYFLAWVYAGLDDKAAALRSLETAFRDQSGWVFWIKVDPRLKPLHTEAGFRDLLKRMKLEP